jgi:catechol 2,3-dioxygenase-like lactoylglutathione lyase family enzyme
MSEPFVAYDHVQLAMPAGEEERARAFYLGVLGMTELEKPADLKKRGGAWFASGSLQLHLGVEADFRPALKAHPALRCSDFDALTQRLRSNAVEVRVEAFEDGLRHGYIADPFGNRIELIASA